MGGSFYSEKRGTTPRIRLDWDLMRQEVANNRSLVKLSVTLVNSHDLWYSGGKHGTLDGTSFTSGGYNGSGNRTLYTRNVWMGHDRDGSKRRTIDASFNLNGVNWSGFGNIGNLYVRGTITLPKIPRASTMSGLSLSFVKPDSTATLSFKIDRKYSGYSHLISLYDGSKWLWDTNYGVNTPTSFTVSASGVNRILQACRNASNKKLTVKLRTYSGSDGTGFIGIHEYTVTARVHPDVRPEIFSADVAIDGEGHDKKIGQYVQNVTKLFGEFRSSSTGFAGVSYRKITVRNGSDEYSNGKYRDNHYEITTPRLKHPGRTSILFKIVDTRGREATRELNVNVSDYSPPQIASPKVERVPGGPPIFKAQVKQHTLDGKNKTSFRVKYRETEEGYWRSDRSWTLGTRTTTQFVETFRNHLSDTKVYDIKLEAEDSFGLKTEVVLTLPTGTAFISFIKDEAVGIGKVPTKKGLLVKDNIYIGESEQVAIKHAHKINNYYIKFYNGTLICCGSLPVEYSSSRYADARWTFPHVFTNPPYVQLTMSTTDPGSFWGSRDHIERVTPDGVTIGLRAQSGEIGTNTRIWFDVIAIGRWKNEFN